MNVTVEAVSGVQKRVRVEIPAETVKAELESVYRKLSKSVRIKGFRPGKAPRSVIERHYKPQAEQEAISSLIGQSLPKAMEEQSIDPVAEPEFEKADIGDDGVLTFEALVAIRPAFEPQDYKGLAVDRKMVSISDERVEQEIASLRERQAQMAPVEEDRPLVSGDFADIDFEGFVDGVAFKGGKAEGYLLELGSGSFIPGFEEQLVGARSGEAKTVNVPFPGDYGNKQLAGKDATFKVKVNGIKKREIPELTDAFAKSLEGAGLETVDGLRRFMKDELTRQAEGEAGRDMRQALAEKLVEANPFDVPPVMVEHQLKHVLETAKQQLLYGGLPLKQIEMLIEHRKDDYRKEAERQVRFSLILDRIAEIESIGVSDEELHGKLEEIARMSDKPVEAVAADYQKDNRIEILRGRLRDEKVVDLIVQHAKITLVDPPPEADHAHGDETREEGE
jgi:trigger factor